MRHRRRRPARVLTVALVVTAVACGNDGDSAAGGRDRQVTFGAVVELSGDQQLYGQPVAAGFEAAAEAINAEGGIEAAGETYEAAVTVVDDRSDPSRVASAAQEVVQAQPVAAMSLLNEQVAYEQWRAEGIITFVSNFEMQGVLEQEPDEHPSLFTPAPFHARAYDSNLQRVAELFPDIRRVAILAPQGELGEGSVATYESSAEAAGMEVVHSALYPPGTTDFSALLTATKAASPDLLIAQQSPEDAVFGDEEPPLVPAAAIVTYYVYRLLAQAIEEADTVEDPEAIAEALVGQSHDGPFGTCTVSPERDLHCEVLLEVVNDGAADVYRYPDPYGTEPDAHYVCSDGSCTQD